MPRTISEQRFETKGSAIRVLAFDKGQGRGSVAVVLGARAFELDWSEADKLAAMLSDAADELYQEGRVNE